MDLARPLFVSGCSSRESWCSVSVGLDGERVKVCGRGCPNPSMCIGLRLPSGGCGAGRSCALEVADAALGTGYLAGLGHIPKLGRLVQLALADRSRIGICEGDQPVGDRAPRQHAARSG